MKELPPPEPPQGSPPGSSPGPSPALRGNSSAGSAPPPPPQRSRLLWRLGIAGGLSAAAVVGLGLAADRIAAGLYAHWRPRLERQIGRVMGRPLQLGPYRGLGPEGLRVGPSRFLPGAIDGSSLSVEGLTLNTDPLAAWRTRTLPLDLSFQGARADLHRNARGQVWVLGKLPPGKPPRLDLRFQLLEPGQLRLWGFGQGSGALPLTARGQVRLQTHQQQLDLRLRLEQPGLRGALLVSGDGNWRRHQLQALLQARRFPLAAVQSLLRGGRLAGGRIEGLADGRVQLALAPGRASCSGSLDLRQLGWRRGGSAAGAPPLTIERAPLRCQGQELLLGSSDWRYGNWRGQIAGRLAADRRLAASLEAIPPASDQRDAVPLLAQLQGQWQRGGLRVERLVLRRRQAVLSARGWIGRQLELDSRWRVQPAELPRAGRLPTWLTRQPLSGELLVGGTLGAPRLQLRTGQADHPLLGPWRSSWRWQNGLLELLRFESRHLQARAELPLAPGGGGLVIGPLQARLNLRDYPLARLNPVLGSRLQGQLDGRGRIAGPLGGLQPDLELRVHRPGAGPLLLRETWQGRLWAGNHLDLVALAPARPGHLQVHLNRRWQPVWMRLQRSGGRLELAGSPRRYTWQARDLPLEGLALAPSAHLGFRPIDGELSGSGRLELQPLAIDGRVSVQRPQFLGFGGRLVALRGTYAERSYRLQGRLEPLPGGLVSGTASGRWHGPFQASLRGSDLNTGLFRQLRALWPQWRGRPLLARGQASDLAGLAIDTLGGSLQDQLTALREAQDKLLERDVIAARASRAERLAQLQVRLDADLDLSGPDLSRIKADLVASGHLWLAAGDRDRMLARDPFELRVSGPISFGSGEFSLSGLPLSLLTLLTPVPPGLRGRLEASGRYRLGKGGPGLVMELALRDGAFGQRGLTLERGRLILDARELSLDLALRADGAFNSVDLAGRIPLERRRSGLELRLASRGDGLHFLTDITGEAFAWKRGSTDLQLLVRGSLAEPIANGFLRLRQGEAKFIGQNLRQIEATVLFDFEQMIVQDLHARVGRRGTISGEGRLALVHPSALAPPLAVKLVNVPFSVPRVTAVSNGRLELNGSLTAPQLTGDLQISQGSINATPAEVGTSTARPGSDQAVQPTSVSRLIEQKWDFQKPLVLLGPEVESRTGESLRQAIPRFPYLTFDNLRLRFGPELRVVMANVANFTTAGSLRINGRLDPSLRASGVVRLLGGRLNLFTTSFSLDPDTPNVAIFTPSMGLVPYLDIALRTRISDSLNVIAPTGIGASGLAGGVSQAEIQSQGGFSSLSQLNLILVTVSVSGPADRIAETLRLSSSPPLPQERLVALIGGNSLAGLSGGGAGTALATVLGQSLLSPLLTSLSDAFGQRVSIAFYPTYVNPAISTASERTSRRVPPQLVLGAEIGYDLSNRFNASVLAAPNRSDIPPQLTLNYKASETLNLEGSIDTQGAWQTQLRLFLRF